MLTLSKSMPVIHNREKQDDSIDPSSELNMYLIHSLTKQIKHLEICKDKINKLEKLTKCDVEQLVDALLHGINDNDKHMYKTGVEFMKHTVSGILSDK
jgi:uncharacterized protein YbaP (TraB family)